MSKFSLATITCSIVVAAIPALAQEDYTRFKSEGTVQAMGSFVKDTTKDGVRQSTDNTGGVLATYRYYFDRHNGVEVNYGYTSNTEKHNGVGLDSRSHEISAAYVYRMPMKRWSPFVLAGAGGLIFDPKNYSGATTQARASFLYGGGADVNVTDHFFLRAEYRGQVYNSPTYDYVGFKNYDRVTHLAEPSVGFGWRF